MRGCVLGPYCDQLLPEAEPGPDNRCIQCFSKLSKGQILGRATLILIIFLKYCGTFIYITIKLGINF